MGQEIKEVFCRNVPEVDGILKIVKDLLALGVDLANTTAEEDHGTTGSTKRLVGGGGDDIGVFKGRLDDTGGDETRDVGHVDNQVGTDEVGDLAHASVVDLTAVRRGTGNESLGAVEDNSLLEHIVVDDAGGLVDAVRHSLEVCRNGRDPELRLETTQSQKIIEVKNSLLGRGLVTVG